MFGLLWWQEQTQDPDRPGMVRTTPKSDAVLARAKELAYEGREDAAAVEELRALAHGSRRTLRLAERGGRFGGHHRELAFANRVNRLLQAACKGGAVPPVSEDDRARIAVVEAFRVLPVEA